MLLSIAVYYKKQPEIVHRFNVQICLILIFIDVFWLIIMGFVWTHENNDSEYWKELSTLHNIVRYGVWGEFLLSCAVIGILFFYYKQIYGSYLYPLDLNYESKKKFITLFNLF